ncbi:DNA polymerase III subunit beta [Candidatus Roizmanbacteria bacterium RIFCSPLOWO2_01_FULL_44_13]|uniref:Beta sliding clamp n=1 Tax=Candidatus Roizmanbacteria bacterium RIFCSPLOWO2_01_FULL_44_13 TaxID=1802069 RepID=A0A1F7JCA3_9BACT|nr:MAG: DNA polymerase III subunit beta [Candidatus Roizmanbacteria bacterium RIFCSPLOWO2_01_FULL_44_13]
MTISLLKEEFLEKLNLASKFTSSRLVSASILQGVYLVGEENIIHVYSTNLNYYFHTSIKAPGKNKFNAAVEPKKLAELLSLLPGGKIDISVGEKNVEIESGKIKAEFPLLDAKEFPLPPKITGSKQKIKAGFLRKNLPTVIFSASSDETRPALTGVNFVADDEGLKMISTDGFRLSLLTLKKEESLPSMIIPAQFLNEVMRLITEDEIGFSYSPEEKTMVFYVGDCELYTRLIEGDYPPYEKVIPTDKKTTAAVDREEFLRNVKLVSIFARDYSNVVVLNIEKGEVSIRPKTGDTEKNVVVSEAAVEGEPQKIAFNYKFLIDFLTNTTSKKIIIELLRSDAPAVFKPDGVDNFIHIIMPVRIQ